MGIYADEDARYVFDNNLSSQWTTTTIPSSFSIDLGPYRSFQPASISLRPHHAYDAIFWSWELYGMNVGDLDWTLIGKRSNINSIRREQESGGTFSDILSVHPVDSSGAFRYLKFVGTSGSPSGYYSLSVVDMHGHLNDTKPGVGTNYYPPSLLSDCNDLLHNEGAVVTASSTAGGSPANLIDGNFATEWYSSNTGGSWIDLVFPHPVLVEGLGYLGRSTVGDYNILEFDVLGWNGTSWDTIKEVRSPDGRWKDSNWNFWFLDPSATSYTTFRIQMVGNNTNGSSYMVCRELDLFGTIYP